MMKRTKLFLVPANDRILVLEADEQATQQLEAGAAIDTIKFKGKTVDHAIVISFEGGKAKVNF